MRGAVGFSSPSISRRFLNDTGCRPVDRVAGSLISWLGGGVQPANRSKKEMFGDEAPIWRFKQRLGAIEDPQQACSSEAGVFLLEVFPALAIPSFADAFCTCLGAPGYNPARRKTFKQSHWQKSDQCTVGCRGAVVSG